MTAGLGTRNLKYQNLLHNTFYNRMTNQHINLDYLDLMTDGDEEMRQTMLEMIIEEIPAEMEKMRESWQSGDLAAIKEISHKMKSTLAFVGNDQLTDANRAIENIARGNASETGFAEHFSKIEQALPLVLGELSEIATV